MTSRPRPRSGTAASARSHGTATVEPARRGERFARDGARGRRRGYDYDADSERAPPDGPAETAGGLRMTDAPEGPAEGEPEHGTRRSSRVGDGGSPVGSTLSIVLAVIAVIAGFLILRADHRRRRRRRRRHHHADHRRLDARHGHRPSSSRPSTGGSDRADGAAGRQDRGDGRGRQRQRRPRLGRRHDAGADGSRLHDGRRRATPPVQTSPATIVYYVDGDATAQAVAALVAADMGGVQTGPMPIPPPIQQGSAFRHRAGDGRHGHGRQDAGRPGRGDGRRRRGDDRRAVRPSF